MVNEIRNFTTTISSGALGDARRHAQQKPSKVATFKPHRADENYIPAPESLATMIRSALSALKSGTYWDRGSILNLLV